MSTRSLLSGGLHDLPEKGPLETALENTAREVNRLREVNAALVKALERIQSGVTENTMSPTAIVAACRGALAKARGES